MKKITLAAAVLGMMMGLASCESTTNPKLNNMSGDPSAVSFQINTPTWASQELVLNTDAEPAKTFDVIVNEQPDYGFSAPVNYTLQASLDGNWATSPVYNINYDIAQTGENRHTILATQSSLADAITALNGYTQEVDKATGKAIIKKDGVVFEGEPTEPNPTPVYLRAVAKIGDLENSVCYSNTVKVNAVNWSLHFRAAGYIFLVGDPQGWNIGESSMMLFESEDQIGTKIYTGTFDISAASANNGFRFYTELGGWGNDGQLPSIGAAANDGDNKDVTLDSNSYAQVSCVYGKGNFKITNWEGGKMQITVNLNSMKVTFQKAQ